ncbi:MAG: LacI family transcriptional regulator [Actinobacteria bacterium]|nr:LacI family transcriptional regulator [Actinomycetota bacterium]
MSNIKDVAKLAGVSIASVSRYLNHPEIVKPATRKDIQEAIVQLSFRPSVIAQSMRNQSSRYIALVLEEISNPFYTEVLNGAEECALKNGYSIVVLNINKDLNKKMLYNDIVFRRGFVGVIYCFSMVESDEKMLNNLKKKDIHFALIENEMFRDRFLCINTNNYKAGFDGTKYLIGKGHKKIAFIGFNRFSDQINMRKKGYLDALEKYSLKGDPALIYETDLSVDGGFKIAEMLKKNINDYTAIFCCSDTIAIGVIKYFHKNGIKVPLDISILGFDDIEWSKIVEPELTTVHQHKQELGYKAVEKIISLIDKNKKQKSIILDAEIVERESVRDISGK